MYTGSDHVNSAIDFTGKAHFGSAVGCTVRPASPGLAVAKRVAGTGQGGGWGGNPYELYML